MQLHGIPTSKIYRPIWQQLQGIARFFVTKLLEVKFFVDNYLAMECKEKSKEIQMYIHDLGIGLGLYSQHFISFLTYEWVI